MFRGCGVGRGALAGALLCLLATIPAADAAPELPPGFELTTFFHVFTGPETVSWAPDGSLWIGQSGPGEGMHVWVWRDGVVTKIHSFPWTPSGERGLHTLVVDPDYLENGRIWIYHTAYEPVVHNRLSHFSNPRITHSAPDKHHPEDDLTDEVIVFEGPELLSFIHNGGCLAFAQDGTLFIGAGDDNQGSNTAQDLSDVRGKILHLHQDGSPVEDNPWFDDPAADPRVWALGLRNPFRCAMQPGLDNLFISDVGGATWEEINVGVPGANYGWALVEGPSPPGSPGFVYPVHSYNHNGEGAAVIAGDHAEPGDFAPEFEGDFFFGDWARNELYRMVLDPNNNPVSVETFASDIGFVTDLEFGPDGAMYLSARNTGGVTISRIEYVGGENRQPNAVATVTPTSGHSPLAVRLDGSSSSDPDDDPLTYRWSLGDGSHAVGALVERTYPQGVYFAELTVDDGQGLLGVAQPTRIVSGNLPPTGAIVAPLAGTTYDAGQTFAYSGSATDLQDGALPCSSYSWQVVFHHDEHTHPFLGPEQGSCGGQFTIPVIGETSPDVWYRIHLVVEDLGSPIGPEGRLTHHRMLDLLPNKADVTLASLPLTNLRLGIDTVPVTAPYTFEGVTGTLRELSAPPLQPGSNGRWYRFASWSDGGAQSHDISTPASDTIFTASFACVPDELTDLRLAPDGDEVVLSWKDGSPHCFSSGVSRYRIYASDTAVPAGAPGNFPGDPAFRLVGTSSKRSFRYVPLPEDVYFVVIGTNPQAQPGLAGHYDSP